MTDGTDPQDILESADSSLLKFQKTIGTTQDRRHAALSKMEPLLETATNISEDEKPSQIDAKMNIVNTYLTALDKIDKASHTNATMSMKKHESDSRDDEGKKVIEFIRQLAGRPDPFQDQTLDNISGASEKVDEQVDSKDIVIDETELREDPNNLS